MWKTKQDVVAELGLIMVMEWYFDRCLHNIMQNLNEV